MKIAPQPGPQTQFATTSADIALFGGASGGGKTFWLICEPLRHVRPMKDKSGKSISNLFNAVTFRRTYKQITEAGGMWSETMHIYPQLGAVPKVADLRWEFPGGASIRFRHLQHEQDRMLYQGAQIGLLCFDQAEQFSSEAFWYLLQRNRSMSGIRPYVRMTCNPDPDCFLAEMIDWWLDEDGYPIKDRSGILRYFIRLGEQLIWADTPQELVEQHSDYFERTGVDPRYIYKSFTFIPSNIRDNQILMEKNPTYLANLWLLPEIERERLLHGNWKIRPAAGNLFNRAWFIPSIDKVPPLGIECRFWDLAASVKKGADYTVGIKIRRVRDAYFITDMIKVQMGPAEVDLLMFRTALADYENAKESTTHYAVRWEIEGGSSGLRDDHRLRDMLRAFDCGGIRPQGDKVVRAKPLAAASQRGDIRLLRGDWNDEWLTHMHHQPDWSHDDIMDASTGAYNALSGTMMTTEEVITMPWQSIGPAF